MYHPPWTKLGRTIESATRKALFAYKMLEGVDRLGIALSGGKDSITMMLMLNAIQGRGFPKCKLFAFHIGGSFSCGASIDQGYLSNICQQLNIPLISQTTEMQPTNCYPCSRNRRSLLFSAAKEHEIDTMAFGHHRDDNAQTLLLNMLHKGECAGLLPKVPMKKYGITIIRPLIFVAEKQIQQFAETQNFLRVMCRCPIGQNSMRHQVDQAIDQLQALFPNIRTNLSHASLTYGSDKALTP